MTVASDGSVHPYSQLSKPTMTEIELDVLGLHLSDTDAPYPELDYGDDAPVLPIKPNGGAITMVDSPPKSPAFTANEQYYSPQQELPNSGGNGIDGDVDTIPTLGIDPNIDAFHPGYADMGQLYLLQRIEPFPSDIPQGRDRDVSTPTVQIHPLPPHNDHYHRESPQPPSEFLDLSNSQSGGFNAFPTEPLHTSADGKRQLHPYTLPPHLQPQQPQQPFNYQSQEMSPERAPALSPRFATRILGELPGLNSLLALSLVTNLNLNHGPGSQELMLRLETLLLVPGVHNNNHNNLNNHNKYGHTRLVSLLLSFFYDRSDTALMIDFSQNVIQQYLGTNSSHLLPRMKTIDLYRKNAKKLNDPTVIFQFAQYMLQTALMMDDEAPAKGTSPNSKARSPALPTKRNQPSQPEVDERKLRRSLIKEAVHYLRKLLDKGYSEAQYLLGDAFSLGALGKVENREAFVLFQQAAKHGHVELAYRTLICFEEGLGTGRDARKAVDYLKIAASRNHPAAMYKLGMYMFHGRMGISRNMNNEKMGIKWLTRALNVANELTSAAPYELGKLYFNGYKDIIIPDKNYALELYSQAAALGHVQAAALLGQFYEVGEVVPQDGNLSIHYYTQAALGGDPELMLAMCAWYLVGCEPHLPKDENEAFEWAKRAASCGLPKAQFAVANFYDKGIGCIKNVQDAQKWYQKAAANGDEKLLARITDKLAAAKIQKEMKKRPKRQNNLGPEGIEDKECVIM